MHRFYEIWEGQINIGGVNISEKLDHWGKNVSMVLQEPFYSLVVLLINLLNKKCFIRAGNRCTKAEVFNT